MKKRLFSMVILLVVVLSSAFAFKGYVDITNDTGYTIFYIYVSHHTSDSWEEDVLDDDVLMDGDTFRLILRDYPDSVFDIKVEDEDGDTYVFWEVDIAEEDITVTLADLEM
ncbi:hypothetical protein [Spirochaeta lutea]|uniref:Uncharacterized protein n=1 Tax=Spirochaeta lutea TaxID=1480694 RepID=A0A098QVX9_9SPIO|nr:hypothetical protein [Spirochaeta lutea]KGE72025.1 hypothetical protein DC28_07885 [Spirochaeta lutea]